MFEISYEERKSKFILGIKFVIIQKLRSKNIKITKNSKDNLDKYLNETLDSLVEKINNSKSLILKENQIVKVLANDNKYYYVVFKMILRKYADKKLHCPIVECPEILYIGEDSGTAAIIYNEWNIE